MYITFIFIILIVYAIYYAVNILLDKSGRKSKANQGEITLAGINEHEHQPVHSDALMDEFRKAPVFNQPGSIAGAYEYDAEQDGVEQLDDEDVSRQ